MFLPQFLRRMKSMYFSLFAETPLNVVNQGSYSIRTKKQLIYGCGDGFHHR